MNILFNSLLCIILFFVKFLTKKRKKISKFHFHCNYFVLNPFEVLFWIYVSYILSEKLLQLKVTFSINKVFVKRNKFFDP